MSEIVGEWHRDLPGGLERDVMDMVAKALLLRAGGSVSITAKELREAADIQAEYAMSSERTLLFRIERM